MNRIIDAFIFFNELDLLKVRLDYLNKYVDEFIIVEFSQTFTGHNKIFFFEENKHKFKKYLHKIKHIKIDNPINNFTELKKSLNSKSSLDSFIRKLLINHSHYNKNKIHWVLDSYHRECIHYGLSDIDDNDVVMFSDLDEIPNENFIKKIKINKFKTRSYLCAKQNEFKYYLNYYSNSNWIGTIASLSKWLKNESLNTIKINSKTETSRFIHCKNSGYHFTSLGPVANITKKIKAWGHQEYNNFIVIYFLKYRINAGYDIFFRKMKRLSLIKIDDKSYFDNQIIPILKSKKYKDLVLNKEIPIKFHIKILMAISKFFIFFLKAIHRITDRF
jgi:beta-1,4-mannosyl-glycoprotein beta-1,4-N-acetylglucosaminyltransferase